MYAILALMMSLLLSRAALDKFSGSDTKTRVIVGISFGGLNYNKLLGT
jgi:hypothetical protein